MASSRPKDRKAELLAIARRSRIQWIRSAAAPATTILPPPTTAITANAAAELAIPGAASLQHLFDFLTEVVADGETVSVDALLRQVEADQGDVDDDGNAVPATATTTGDVLYRLGSTDDYTYAVFLDQLCAREAIDVVKAMQQFVTKFETAVRVYRASFDSDYYLDREVQSERCKAFLVSALTLTRHVQAHQAEVARGAERVWAFLKELDADMHDNVQARTPWTPGTWITRTLMYTALYDTTPHHTTPPTLIVFLSAHLDSAVDGHGHGKGLTDATGPARQDAAVLRAIRLRQAARLRVPGRL